MSRVLFVVLFTLLHSFKVSAQALPIDVTLSGGVYRFVLNYNPRLPYDRVTGVFVEYAAFPSHHRLLSAGAGFEITVKTLEKVFQLDKNRDEKSDCTIIDRLDRQ